MCVCVYRITYATNSSAIEPLTIDPISRPITRTNLHILR